MGLSCFPKTSRKMQRTLKNLRVSLLCFLLTFLVLRNTIGAGKFGTPAQDFEEIRLHLHNVALHRRQLRVLAQAVEEEKPLLEFPASDTQESTFFVASEEGALPSSVVGGKVNGKAPSWKKEKQRSTTISTLDEMRGNAVVLNVDIRRWKTPVLTAAKDIPTSLLVLAKSLEGSRPSVSDSQRKVGEVPAFGESKVVVVLGFSPSGCKKPLAEQLLLKSLKNKVHYSTLHGFQVSEALKRQNTRPLSRISLLQDTMEKNPHVEWLWWIPNGALIITDIAFELPLWKYSRFNCVLFGSVGATYLTEDLIISLRTDTFLIRNCQWALEVVRNSVDLSSMGILGTDMLTIDTMVSKPDLEGVGTSSVDDVLLSRPRRTFRGKVYVEDSAVVVGNLNNPDFKLEKIFRDSYTGLGHKRLPFITHFVGCDLCRDVHIEEDGQCLKQMEKAFSLVEEQVGAQRKDLGLSQHSLM